MPDATPMSNTASQSSPPPVMTQAPVQRKKMGFKSKFLLITVSLLMMGLLRTGFMFVLIGMLPSIVAYYMDVTSNRHHFKTIFACNLTGMLPYLGQILEHGPKNAVLQSIMGDPNSWLIIYGSAMMGVILVKICPMFAQFLVLGISHTQTSNIEMMQRRIEKEWGHEVAQFSKERSDASGYADDY